MINALTVDVEDYFQASAFDASIPRAHWDRLESRVVRNTDRLLALFEAADVRATFFILGWVADKYPALVRRISDAGHELASHGFGHRLVYEQTPQEFRQDLRESRAAIMAAAGVPVYGYRAPSFSITEGSRWAFDIIFEEGFLYDASVFPIRHDRYGLPSAPRTFHNVQLKYGGLWECPASTVRLGGMNLPVAGGGYFRLLPYTWTKWGISRLNEREGLPAVFYVHPWEIDPDQPRLAGSALSRFRHYRNLDKTEARMRRLLSEFKFAPLGEVLGLEATQPSFAAASSFRTHVAVSTA